MIIVPPRRIWSELVNVRLSEYASKIFGPPLPMRLPARLTIRRQTSAPWLSATGGTVGSQRLSANESLSPHGYHAALNSRGSLKRQDSAVHDMRSAVRWTHESIKTKRPRLKESRDARPSSPPPSAALRSLETGMSSDSLRSETSELLPRPQTGQLGPNISELNEGHQGLDSALGGWNAGD